MPVNPPQPAWNNDPDYKKYQQTVNKGLGPTPQTNQMLGIDRIDTPFGVTRQGFDNPKFLWPSRQYMDITGETHTVQRGYMRSLITDPQVTKGTGYSKNRRLFFQFNPQILVRSVQQSVGAMNPLLQSPEQLVQPIPGTATFGFELFFNREHEVNSGFEGEDMEWFKLPDGLGLATTARVGVLADILVLDTIVGQGLSEDMVGLVAAYTKGVINNANTAIQTERQRLEDTGAPDEEASKYTDIPVPGDDFTKTLNLNIGNSAFLNPLPFRVIFSSLFMVEGLATSVDVQFQKFSKNMIPTQCKVTINMYALYIGFARSKTFLRENLIAASQDRQADRENDIAVGDKLTGGVNYINIDPIKFNAFEYGSGGGVSIYLKGVLTDMFEKNISKKTVKDVKVNIEIEYGFSTLAGSETLSRTAQVTYDGKTDISIETFKKGNISNKTYAVPFKSNEFSNDLKKEIEKGGSALPRVSFRLKFSLTGKGANDTLVNSQPIYTTTVSKFEYPSPNYGSSTAQTSPLSVYNNSANLSPTNRIGGL